MAQELIEPSNNIWQVKDDEGNFHHVYFFKNNGHAITPIGLCNGKLSQFPDSWELPDFDEIACKSRAILSKFLPEMEEQLKAGKGNITVIEN